MSADRSSNWKAKYGGRIPTFRHENRRWPDNVLEKSPVLFSTDLRDGNQALRNPLTFEFKLRMYHLLLSMGFKEIEVGMPCANRSEYEFIRHLVDTDLIPAGVLIQAITPCSEPAVKRTIESLHGASQAVIFTYLPSSDNYRETVTGDSEKEWIARAVRVTKFARSITSTGMYSMRTKWTFNFGFEDYSNARLEAVVRCADAVKAAWSPSPQHKMLFAIAASVESSTANVFADQIERFCQNVSERSCWRLSVHTHNDRGGAVAAAELASLAGADRVEGCLFGNGERAGNMDLVTYGLNRMTEGIDCGIDFTRLRDARQVYQDVVGIPIHPRTPYSGSYFLKAFSGGHQDAIVKGIERRASAEKANTPNAFWPQWKVPYLPIDPVDIGEDIENSIEINSQSGKSGVRWVLGSRIGPVPITDAAKTAETVKERSVSLGRALSWQEVCQAYEDLHPGRTRSTVFLQQLLSKLQNVRQVKIDLDTSGVLAESLGPQAVLTALALELFQRGYMPEEQSILHVADLCNAEIEAGGLGLHGCLWADVPAECLDRILELVGSWLRAISFQMRAGPDQSLPLRRAARQPMTLAGKILAQHATAASCDDTITAGDVLLLNVDWIIASELSWTGMKRSMTSVGMKPTAWRNDRFWLTADHAVDPRLHAKASVRSLMAGVEEARKELEMTENQGSNYTILHTEFVRERAEPGMLVLGSDSHTCSAGAVSALAIGLGAADVMTALATGKTWLRVPESVRVDFIGEPPWYIGGKDIVLYILRQLKRNTIAADRVVEFGGSGAAALSCDARFAICNMCTELGAITGIFEPDTVVHAYVQGRRKRLYKSNSSYFAADPDAAYFARVTVDLSQVQSYIALYPNPDDIHEITCELGKRFDGIFIGACTTTEEDLILAGLVLQAGLSRGLPLLPGRRLVVPGSLPIVRNLRQLGLLEVFDRCGYERPAPGCSMCLGISADVAPAGTTWLSTQNRNFENRMGKGAIGHLCSAAVAAASSFSMTLTDASDLLGDVSYAAYTAHLMQVSGHKRQSGLALKPLELIEPDLHDCMRLLPPIEGDKHGAVVQGQPGIIASRLYRLGDFVDTDAIIPAVACLGDPSDETLGEHCLEISVPSFRESVHNGQQVVVAGHGFGCGSSREEAPRALRGLGVRCVVARSFAYIFARNMPNIGMLAICLNDDEFFAAAAHGESIAIDTALLQVAVGGRTWSFTLNDIERQLLRVGGLTMVLKEHGEQLFAATSSTANGLNEEREARPLSQQQHQHDTDAMASALCSPSSALSLPARRICTESLWAEAMDDLSW